MTKQFPIAATTVASYPMGQVNYSNRRYLYIKNLLTLPGGSVTQQTAILYVAFGQPATQGENGEIELNPGEYYTWGGPLPPNVGTLPLGFFLPVCPTEYISVISNQGTAYGSIVVQ